MPISIALEDLPLLEARAFSTRFPEPLGRLSSESLAHLLVPGAELRVQASDAVRAAVRDLLRAGGFKPTGRSKPASEYLLRAAGEGRLDRINAAVDACNAASLQSGLPISVVDLERARAPFRIGVAPAGSSYVFNASGQVIDCSGLLCLFDAEGPCANAVKDAQRTKTGEATTATLSVVWGARALGDHGARATAFYRELLARLGAETEDVVLLPAS